MLLHDLRTRIRLAQTRCARVLAAPDRRRRRVQAAELAGPAPQRQLAREAAESVAAEGFSLYELDVQSKDRLLSDWRSLLAARAQGTDAQVQRTTGKAFFEEMLSDADLQRFPAFVATALDERLLATVTHAIGMVPHLESIDILASKPTAGELTASQLWHFDVNDERIVKLFVYLEDCGPVNGPFTFIPANDSQQVADAVGHYVHDDFIAKHVPRQRWQSVEGPAGTAFLIDTGRCYHFGSRCEAQRVAYVITYSSGLKFMKRSRSWDRLIDRGTRLSALQSAVCGVTS